MSDTKIFVVDPSALSDLAGYINFLSPPMSEAFLPKASIVVQIIRSRFQRVTGWPVLLGLLSLQALYLTTIPALLAPSAKSFVYRAIKQGHIAPEPMPLIILINLSIIDLD